MNIEQNEYGAAEHCSFDNWAAEYAKKLFVTEAAERTTADNDEVSARKAADDNEVTVREKADEELSERITSLDNDKASRAELEEGLEKKADITRYASIGQAGLIKLHSGTNNGVKTNKSGIIVSETDGTAYIATKTNGGIARDGAGGLYVVGATETEVKAGTDAYKPVTPSVFKAGVENITGSISSLNSIPQKRKGVTVTLTPTNIVSAYNALSAYIDSSTAMDYLNNEDFNTVHLSNQTSASMTMKANYAYPDGYYIFIPKNYTVSNRSYPIGAITIRNRNNETATITYDFHEGVIYLLSFKGDSSGVVCTLSHTEEYSTTPVQVGTWIDGTPVWRVTLPITKLSDLGFKGDGTREGILTTEILLKNKAVSDIEEVIYINDALIFQNEATYSHDAFAENVSERSPGVYLLGEEETDPATHVYGWIEFAADKSIVEGA